MYNKRMLWNIKTRCNHLSLSITTQTVYFRRLYLSCTGYNEPTGHNTIVAIIKTLNEIALFYICINRKGTHIMYNALVWENWQNFLMILSVQIVVEKLYRRQPLVSTKYICKSMIASRSTDARYYDSYHYLRLAHVSAICFGFPYTRRKIEENVECGKNAENVAGNAV